MEGMRKSYEKTAFIQTVETIIASIKAALVPESQVYTLGTLGLFWDCVGTIWDPGTIPTPLLDFLRFLLAVSFWDYLGLYVLAKSFAVHLGT